MPSKKKSSSRQSRERKGVKRKVEVQQQQGRGALAQTEGADEDALLEEAIKLADAEKEVLEAAAAKKDEEQGMLLGKKKHCDACYHGFKTEDHSLITDFSQTFIRVLFFGKEKKLGYCLMAAEKATKEKHPEVWGDPSKLKQVLSFYLFNGTRAVLDGNITCACTFACLACYLGDYLAVHLHSTKVAFDPTKLVELWKADEHTLVKYLRKNISCKCLDTKYKEVKYITKMGYCYNPQCSIPDRMVERSKMLYCTRCCQANYCSQECQKSHWPVHKEFCDKHLILSLRLRVSAWLDSRE
jgi:hypothetical protein